MSYDWKDLERDGVEFLRFVWCDNANLIRAKAAHISQLESVSEHGLGISFAQQAVPVVRDAFVAESGLGPVGEVRLVPDWSTLSFLPFAPGHARVMSDLTLDGAPWSHCPRRFLTRMIDDAHAMGLTIQAAFENEFYLLRRGPEGLEPADRSLFCSVQAMNKNVDFLRALSQALQSQGIVPVNYYPESGYGQYELSIAHTHALAAADQQLVFRESVHAVAHSMGLVATFLPKPFSDQAGSGCHIHLSLWRDGRNLSAEAPVPDPVTSQFMAGILAHLKGLMALTTPTRNSFARLGRHLWSGGFSCWGYDNREAALRLPTHPSGASHFEVKTHDATANPYLALGALIAAGLDGIRQKMPLSEAMPVDPGLLSDEELAARGVEELPTDVGQALENFQADDVLQRALGPDLARSYLAVKREEERSFMALSQQEEVDMLLERY